MGEWSRFSASAVDDEDREGFWSPPERKNRERTTTLALRTDDGFDEADIVQVLDSNDRTAARKRIVAASLVWEYSAYFAAQEGQLAFTCEPMWSAMYALEAWIRPDARVPAKKCASPGLVAFHMATHRKVSTWWVLTKWLPRSVVTWTLPQVLDLVQKIDEHANALKKAGGRGGTEAKCRVGRTSVEVDMPTLFGSYMNLEVGQYFVCTHNVLATLGI